MSTTLLTEAIAIRRSVASALAAHLKLPLGYLGTLFIDPDPDPALTAPTGRWWESLPANQRIQSDIIAGLAAPALIADIRILLERSTLTKTWALACGIEPEAPWLLLAPITSEGDYHVQPCRDHNSVTALLLGNLSGLSPVWESQMRFQLTTPAFALLLALTDLFSRAQYASLLTQQAIPEGFTMDDVRLGWENAIQRPDQRYLFPFAAHLFPDSLNSLRPSDVAALVHQIVKTGLMVELEQGFFWTDSGRFLAESLHRRNVCLAVEVAGADAGGRLGTQASLFVRSDLPLWYFDIGAETCIAAGVNEEKAGQLLDEILKPIGTPAARQRVSAPGSPLTSMDASYVTPPRLPVQHNAKPSPNWHYAESGQTLGPIRESELRERLARGNLPGNTLVWNPELPDWLTASAAGLLDQSVPTPVPAAPLTMTAACPRCHQTLEPGVRFCTGCGAPQN